MLCRSTRASQSVMTAFSRSAVNTIPLRVSSSSSSGLDGLDPYLRGNAASGGGSGPSKKPYMSYVDTVRAETLLKAKVHLGHQKRKTNKHATGAIYGFRHNIAVYDLEKTWRSMRTLFYAFAEMSASRSSFFLLAPNENLPMRRMIENLKKEYPFRHDRATSLYMTGYSDKKWIDGLFSNWKVTWQYSKHIKDVLAEKPTLAKFRKLRNYLRGVEDLDVYSRIIPDMVLVLATDRGALHEIKNADIPMVGLVDTDTDPRPFLYPVFANDDSLESIQFMLDLMRRGVEEGRRREQEAFALLMIRKIKQQLDPANGSSAALLTPPEAETSNDWLSPSHPSNRSTSGHVEKPEWLHRLDAATGQIRLESVRNPAGPLRSRL